MFTSYTPAPSFRTRMGSRSEPVRDRLDQVVATAYLDED